MPLPVLGKRLFLLAVVIFTLGHVNLTRSLS